MGGDLTRGDLTEEAEGKSPVFLIQAIKDPAGANLERVQIVKGWLDQQGELHEQVYDVAHGGQQGEVELVTVWHDPNFNSAERAFYYARVIEIPTPRWTAYDVKRFHLTLADDIPLTVQERAYTSPIWFSPVTGKK